MIEVRCPRDGASLGDFEEHDIEYYRRSGRFYYKLCPKCGMVWYFRVYTDGKVRIEATSTAILHEGY